MDKNKRRPDHPEFDPTSLYISPFDYKSLSDGMKRYWNIK
jgi:DNA mismatch repair protein MSH6